MRRSLTAHCAVVVLALFSTALGASGAVASLGSAGGVSTAESLVGDPPPAPNGYTYIGIFTHNGVPCYTYENAEGQRIYWPV